MRRAAFADLLLAAGAALGALLALLGVLACAGWPPGEVAATWLHGAVGDGQRLALTLEGACPLLLTGLAAACAFRCGVWNIGAEGQFLAGAAMLVACGTRWALPGPAWLALPVALLLAAAAGAAWALTASALERWRGVPVVLSTILLNLIAVQLSGALVASSDTKTSPRYWVFRHQSLTASASTPVQGVWPHRSRYRTTTTRALRNGCRIETRPLVPARSS